MIVIPGAARNFACVFYNRTYISGKRVPPSPSLSPFFFNPLYDATHLRVCMTNVVECGSGF